MNKRNESKAATAEAVKAAARTLFKLQGYEGVTIRGVATAAGLSTGAVFSTFADKAHLFREIFGRPAPTSAHVASVLIRAKAGQAFPAELETLAKDLVGEEV